MPTRSNDSNGAICLDQVSRAMGMIRVDHSLMTLQRALSLLESIPVSERERDIQKLFGEVNYLIALEYEKTGNEEKMAQHARTAIEYYKEVSVLSLTDAVPLLTDLLPEIMHEEVIKHRLMLDN